MAESPFKGMGGEIRGILTQEQMKHPGPEAMSDLVRAKSAEIAARLHAQGEQKAPGTNATRAHVTESGPITRRRAPAPLRRGV